MKKFKKLLLVSTVLFIVSCKDTPDPPKIEICAIGEFDLMVCPDRMFDITDAYKWTCTSPRDFEKMQDYIILLRNELAKCKLRR